MYQTWVLCDIEMFAIERKEKVLQVFQPPKKQTRERRLGLGSKLVHLVRSRRSVDDSELTDFACGSSQRPNVVAGSLKGVRSGDPSADPGRGSLRQRRGRRRESGRVRQALNPNGGTVHAVVSQGQ